MSYNKIQLLFSNLFGCPINESTVYSAAIRGYEQLEKTEGVIKSKLAASNVAHADESGLCVLGKLHWLHAATTLFYTNFFVHAKRSKIALHSHKSIRNKIIGRLLHDCWIYFFKFTELNHAICGSNLLREL